MVLNFAGFNLSLLQNVHKAHNLYRSTLGILAFVVKALDLFYMGSDSGAAGPQCEQVLILWLHFSLRFKSVS